MRPLIYVADADPVFRRAITAHLEATYDVETFASGADLLARQTMRPANVIVTGAPMPDADGVDVTRQLHAREPAVPVIVVAAPGQIDPARDAVHAGAIGCLLKPVNVDQLLALLRGALAEPTHEQPPRSPTATRTSASGHRPERRQAANEVRVPERRAFSASAILGTHPLIDEVRLFVRRVAEAPGVTILLMGESGTGKNLVARAIHYGSPHAAGRFVEINCSALPGPLLEAELFGYHKGAFTDARESKRGLIETANNGTLFLDEIGDLSADLQAKLLNFLEARRIRPLGGTDEIPVTVRVIAATNRDLPDLVRHGQFREDLYYRLSVATHVMPPLRELQSDIVAIAEHFRDIYAREFGKDVRDIAPDALQILTRWSWPGNVRELRNVIERAMIFVDGPRLEARNLPPLVAVRAARHDDARRETAGFRIAPGLTLPAVEREYIRRTLAAYAGNVQRTAESLGISRKALWEKRKKHGLLD